MLSKDYQARALNALDEWGQELRTRRGKGGQIAKLEKDGVVDGADVQMLLNYPARTWDALKALGKLPVLRDRLGNPFTQPYQSRTDSQGNPIPHACLKIPTGGGKTFLGVSALARLGVGSGLVLWITPSQAIYAQTWEAFKDRAHPYRACLDAASSGKTRLLTKEQPFSRADLEGRLCVMPLMLQAAARKNERNFLRMFRNTGRYPSFFPFAGDTSGNRELLKAHPDLESYALMDGGAAGAVKQSLLNVFKLVRPVIVLDEAHNAYTDERRKQLCDFNPRLVLELSATPDFRKSNILVNISGEELRREQMIKLPLNVSSPPNIDWKQALAFAKKKRDDLEAAAEKFRAETGRYIRPIMLVRVERTGKDQRDGHHVHADDARECLITQLNVPPSHIRRKTAEDNEIAGENLLSEYSQVRYILTRNALQEGWDCAFAYVLAMLDSTTAAKALTQMTGRVLRQPGAELTGVDALDEAYVYCCNRDVGAAVDNVRKGLQGEGLDDVSGLVRGTGPRDAEDAEGGLITAKRRRKFAKLRALLPRVLHRRGRGFAPLDYDADILRDVPWEGIMRRRLDLNPGAVEEIDERVVRVDLPQYRTVSVAGAEVGGEKEVRLEFFARYLGDVIPNSFVAAEIAKRTLSALRKKADGEGWLYDRRYQIAAAMRRDLAEIVEREARTVFCRKLEGGDIRFELREGEDYELPMEDEKPGEKPLILFSLGGGQVAEKSLLEPMLQREFNGLERDFAVLLEGVKAVDWWHRIAARRGYSLQGWQRHRVYPDFVVCVNINEGRERRLLVLETKGKHLSGNDDTTYKEDLLNILSAKNPRALECGDFTLKTGGKLRKMVLRVLLEKGWQEEFGKLAGGG